MWLILQPCTPTTPTTSRMVQQYQYLQYQYLSSPCSTRHSCVPMLLNTNNVIVHHINLVDTTLYGNHYNGQLGGYYIIPGSLSTSSTAYKV